MLTVQSPAKLNLYLRVARPRPDGFHPLVSWFVTVDLFDTLHFERVPTPGVHLSSDDPKLTVDDTNLVTRAARLLLPPSEGVRIHLEKRIPAGGGLGGGSSNAATTLRALKFMFRLKADLDPLAATLGSDINFFLHAPSAICTSRGECVAPTAAPPIKAALLVLPDLHVSTPAVFRQFDALGHGSPLQGPTLQPANALALLPALTNDLEPATFSLLPGLGDLRTELERTLGRPVRMSGSGSTLFTLYDSPAEAGQAIEKVSKTVSPGVRTLSVSLCPPDSTTAWANLSQPPL